MSNIDTESAGKILGYTFVGLVIVALVGLFFVAGHFVGGLVLSIMWKWFIVTTFDAPALSIAEAIGIILIMNLFHRHLVGKGETDDGKSGFKWLVYRSLIMPFVMLGIAWIVYQFI